MSELLYEPWEHFRDDKSNSAPVGDVNGNIIGLELELTGFGTYSGLNAAIDDGVLETSDSGRAYIQLEYEAQSNVEFEAVFNADAPENVMERVRELNRYIAGDFGNHRACSAHVHVNRAHLENIGVNGLDYYRAAEALAPFIYAISGRNEDAWESWCESRVNVFLHPADRLKHVDAAEPRTREEYGGDARYELCNMQNSKTIEIRGFSNYYDINTELIEVYIEIADDLIPSLALKMAGKEYAKNPEILFKSVERFIKKHAEILHGFNLNAWKDWESAVLASKRAAFDKIICAYNESMDYLRQARQCADHDQLRAAENILEALRANRELHAENVDLINPLVTINELETQLQNWFKNSVWRA